MESDISPMEIDVSLNSSNTTNLSNNNSKDEEDFLCPAEIPIQEESSRKEDGPKHYQPDLKNVKRLQVNLKDVKKRPSKIYYRIFGLIIAIFCVVVHYYICRLTCIEKIDLTKLKDKFYKVYGQPHLYEELSMVFDSDDKVKVTYFVGGTGVGKTYVANFILHTLGKYENVHHSVAPFHKSYIDNIIPQVAQCENNYIFLDGLSSNDLNVSHWLRNIINQSNDYDKNFHFILIYNNDLASQGLSKQTDHIFKQNLSSGENLNAIFHIIEFHKLSQDHLRMCIEEALVANDQYVTSALVDEVAVSLNVTNDGCKGVTPRIRLRME